MAGKGLVFRTSRGVGRIHLALGAQDIELLCNQKENGLSSYFRRLQRSSSNIVFITFPALASFWQNVENGCSMQLIQPQIHPDLPHLRALLFMICSYQSPRKKANEFPGIGSDGGVGLGAATTFSPPPCLAPSS
jgi:hypothetical protein